MNKIISTSVIITLLMIMLTGCASLVTPLITPKVKTDIATLKAGQYSLDKSHATVLFKVQHLGLSTYVGRFNEFDATLEFDPQNIQAAKLEAIIEMASLDINDDDLEKDLMGRSWFDQKSYPQARFTTISVTPITDNSFTFTGELDWRGVKKPIDMTVTFNGGANNILTGKYTLGFSAKGSFKRAEFGMNDFIPLVGNEINIEAFAEFQKN
ncbi:MAG: YceI family protein [Acidiferrobacterales bacterium]|nr:YceI family protein [Acidiferrobacterales bacterium]